MSIIPLHIRSVIILCRDDGVLVFIHMYHAHVSLVNGNNTCLYVVLIKMKTNKMTRHFFHFEK